MKKLIIVTLVFLIFAITYFIQSRGLTGAGIRLTDGRFMGYSGTTNEWLFMKYQNIPVRVDGPYVLDEDDNRYAIYVEGNDKSLSSIEKKLVKDRVEVIADNDVSTQFIVPLRTKYTRSKLTISEPEKILVLSDLEGEFDAMVNILKVNGVIDDSLSWTYGKGHLVLNGDMVDRGINVVPILWLIYKLEAEAKAAAGAVHYVLGNHERYLLDGRTKSVAKKYHGTFRTTGMSQKELWSENSELGRWLRSKPTAITVGDTLFVHAGISPKVITTNPTLESFDNEASNNFTLENTMLRNSKDSVLHDSLGILYYRGLALDRSDVGYEAKASDEHVELVLKKFAVKRIAIGHTLAKHIGYDYNFKVIRTDVNHALGHSEALLIEGDLLWRIDKNGNKLSLEQVINQSE